MVKLILLFFLLIGMHSISYGNRTNEQILRQGTTYLYNGDYDKTISLLEYLNTQGFKSSALYCNLGSAYYKSGHPGKAIYFYEKGLLLSPFDPRLIHNRNLINTKLNIASNNFFSFYNVDDTFVLKIIDEAIFIAVILLFLSGIFFIMLSFKILSKFKRTIKLTSSSLLFISLPALILLSGFLIYYNSENKGVIIKASIGRAAPGGLLKKGCLFKEGEKVSIINYYDGWYKIKKYDEEEGWVPVSDFWVLN